MKSKSTQLSVLVIGSLLLLSMGIIRTNQDIWEAPEEYQKMKNPYNNVEDEDWIGRTIYSKHCKFCHGPKGKGDGNQANLLQTKVADFTTDKFKSQTDGSIYFKIKKGRNEMMSFDKIITDDEDMWMVVNYIKGM